MNPIISEPIEIMKLKQPNGKAKYGLRFLAELHPKKAMKNPVKPKIMFPYPSPSWL